MAEKDVSEAVLDERLTGEKASLAISSAMERFVADKTEDNKISVNA